MQRLRLSTSAKGLHSLDSLMTVRFVYEPNRYEGQLACGVLKALLVTVVQDAEWRVARSSLIMVRA